MIRKMKYAYKLKCTYKRKHTYEICIYKITCIYKIICISNICIIRIWIMCVYIHIYPIFFQSRDSVFKIIDNVPSGPPFSRANGRWRRGFSSSLGFDSPRLFHSLLLERLDEIICVNNIKMFPAHSRCAINGSYDHLFTCLVR